MLRLSFALDINFDVPPDVSFAWKDHFLPTIETSQMLMATIPLMALLAITVKARSILLLRAFNALLLWPYMKRLGPTLHTRKSSTVYMQAGPTMPMPMPTAPIPPSRLRSSSSQTIFDRTTEERPLMPRPSKTNANQRALILWYSNRNMHNPHATYM